MSILTRADIVTRYHAFINQYNIPPEKARVDAGGAMTMLGLREATADIDITMALDEFEQLNRCKGRVTIVPPSGQGLIMTLPDHPDIDIHLDMSNDMSGMITMGVFHQSAMAVWLMKQRLARPKDVHDLQVLESYLKLHGELPYS